MQLPLVVFVGPAEEYLNLSELAAWLKLKPKELRQLIKDKRIPEGQPRPKRSLLYWTRQDAAVVKWILDNQTRFGANPQGDSDEATDE